MTPAQPHQRGLTLVEVLVAMAIFAAVSAIGVAGLNLAARGAAQLTEAEARIGQVERMRGVLRRDLESLADRPVREAQSALPRPAFVGGRPLETILPAEDRPLLSLVRSGWVNPGAAQPRAELQAVTYLYQDDKIVRRVRPFLDAVQDTPYADDTMLEELTSVEIAFRWGGRWQEGTDTAPSAPLPSAVRLRLEHNVYGEIETVLLVAGGGGAR